MFRFLTPEFLSIHSKESFLASIEKLRSAKLDCSDFVSVCERNVARGDFVYLDPPYYVPKQRVFREYVPHDFAREDIDRLKNLLELIDGRGGHFLLNYPDCYMMRKIARRWSSRRSNKQIRASFHSLLSRHWPGQTVRGSLSPRESGL